MSLFTVIKYPVTKDTTDFTHLPDEIWNAYMDIHRTLTVAEHRGDKKDNRVIRKLIEDWED